MRKDKVVTEVLGEDLALSPSDVIEKRFRRAVVGGYDRAEVDRFLERTADILEDLIEEVRNLKAVQQEQKQHLEEYRRMEATLRDALIAAQKLSDETLDAARREAAAIIEAAKLQKERMELEARRIPAALMRDIQVLEQQRNRLRIETLAILDAHRQLLDTHIPEQPAFMPPSFTNIGFLAAPAEEEQAKESGPAEEAETDGEERASASDELPGAVLEENDSLTEDIEALLELEALDDSDEPDDDLEETVDDTEKRK